MVGGKRFFPCSHGASGRAEGLENCAVMLPALVHLCRGCLVFGGVKVCQPAGRCLEGEDRHDFTGIFRALFAAVFDVRGVVRPQMVRFTASGGLRMRLSTLCPCGVVQWGAGLTVPGERRAFIMAVERWSRFQPWLRGGLVVHEALTPCPALGIGLATPRFCPCLCRTCTALWAVLTARRFFPYGTQKEFA